MNKNNSIFQNNNKLLLQLTKGLFWNSDINKLDYLRDKKYIIERILDVIYISFVLKSQGD